MVPGCYDVDLLYTADHKYLRTQERQVVNKQPGTHWLAVRLDRLYTEYEHDIVGFIYLFSFINIVFMFGTCFFLCIYVSFFVFLW